MCVELITFVGLFGAPKHLWWIFVKSRSIPFFEEVAMSLTVIFGTFFIFFQHFLQQAECS